MGDTQAFYTMSLLSIPLCSLLSLFCSYILFPFSPCSALILLLDPLTAHNLFARVLGFLSFGFGYRDRAYRHLRISLVTYLVSPNEVESLMLHNQHSRALRHPPRPTNMEPSLHFAPYQDSKDQEHQNDKQPSHYTISFNNATAHRQYIAIRINHPSQRSPLNPRL